MSEKPTARIDEDVVRALAAERATPALIVLTATALAVIAFVAFALSTAD